MSNEFIGMKKELMTAYNVMVHYMKIEAMVISSVEMQVMVGGYRTTDDAMMNGVEPLTTTKITIAAPEGIDFLTEEGPLVSLALAHLAAMDEFKDCEVFM